MAHQYPHHPPQKSAGGEHKSQPLPVIFYQQLGCGEFTVSRSIAVWLPTHRPKITVTGQYFNGFLHQFHVHVFLRVKGAQLAQEGIFRGVDSISVGPRDGIFLCMGIPGYFDKMVDGNVVWQYSIESKNGVVVKVTFHLDMAEILTGMHAGIRPTSTDTIDLVAQHFLQCPLQRFLNAGVLWLPLPAVVVRAFVG